MPCQCKYIALYRGDDSDFEYNQKVALDIKTDLPLDGCSAHFSLYGVQQDFDEIPQDKSLTLVFPSSVTSKFPLGMANGTLWLLDSEGKRRTLSTSIHFRVTTSVEEAYGDDSERQRISVEISGPLRDSSYIQQSQQSCGCNCAFIMLYRGDDTDFSINENIYIVIDSDFDMTGFAAHFSLYGVQQDFEEIPQDGKLELVFNASDTAKFPIGPANGKVWLTDSSGKVRTISNNIHFFVTESVADAYSPDNPHAVTVGISTTIDYGKIVNKPKINGVTLEGNLQSRDIRILVGSDNLDMMGSDWDLRCSVASLWRKLGGSVLNEE